MGIALFALFSAMEAAFAVLSCVRGKITGRGSRAVFCAAELAAVLVVILLPSTGQKWRFTVCAVIFAVRLAVSGAVWLAKRGRKDGVKSKAKTAAAAAANIFLIGFALFPAFIFTGYMGLETSGSFKVKETRAILTDSGRTESHETDGSFREIPVHIYYPENCSESCPLVVFAHGSFGWYQSNASLYSELASNGYVTVSIDHPYYALFTTDTDGRTIIADMEFMRSAVDVQNGARSAEESFRICREWLELRTADENFVLDAIKSAKSSASLDSSWYTESDDIRTEILAVLEITDTDTIGLAGHSIGGAAAVQLGRERGDIAAAVDIDGTMIGERTGYSDGGFTYNEEPYPIPLLSLDSAVHWTDYASDFTYENGLPYINKYVLDNAADGREAHFDGTDHMDFTDLPLLSPVLAKMLGKGDADPSEFIPEMNGIILNYFDFYLKGKGEPNTAPWNY